MPPNIFSMFEDWDRSMPIGTPNVTDNPADIPRPPTTWQEVGDWVHGRGREYLDAFARAGRYLDAPSNRQPVAPSGGRGAGIMRGFNGRSTPWQSRQPENLAGRSDQNGLFPRFYTYGSFAQGGPVMPRGTLTPHDLMLLQNFAPGFSEGGSPDLLRGPGGGQDDNIVANDGNVRVSPGEYVVSAEDVSMLGDGSNEEGAKRLDRMRGALRRHKYGTSKFPPKARNPLSYLRRAS